MIVCCLLQVACWGMKAMQELGGSKALCGIMVLLDIVIGSCHAHFVNAFQLC